MCHLTKESESDTNNICNYNSLNNLFFLGFNSKYSITVNVIFLTFINSIRTLFILKCQENNQHRNAIFDSREKFKLNESFNQHIAKSVIFVTISKNSQKGFFNLSRKESFP